MHPRRALRRLLLPAILILCCSGAAPAQRAVPLHPFPEGAASIDHLLLQFEADSLEDWLPAARDLLMALPVEVHVTIAVLGGDEANVLEASLAEVWSERIEVLVVGASPTPWARDRMLAVGGGARGGILLPPSESVADGYFGDLDAAMVLAARTGKACTSPALSFQGGDIAGSARRVFVGWNTVASNAGVGTTEEVVGDFERLFGLDVVVVGEPDPPHEHLDMYLTVLGEGTVALGDPTAGRALLGDLARADRLEELPEFDTWSAEAQRSQIERYDTIRVDLERRGLRVLRVPILHGEEGGMLTWNNCLVERRGRERRVYMPSYGVPELDGAAERAYREAGFRVLPITAVGIAASGGTVRCLTNVVSWTEARPAARVTSPIPR